MKRLQSLRDYLSILGAWRPERKFADNLGLASSQVLDFFQQQQPNHSDAVPPVVSYDNGRLKYHYRIPSPFWKQGTASALNSKSYDRSSLFPLSGFLAVIDIITTWGLMLNEPRKGKKGPRPGVSVTLYTELLDIVGSEGNGRKPGDTVEVDVGVMKVGQTMAFTDAKITHLSTGHVICTGRHTKFLPLGMMMDTALSTFLPWTAYILSAFPKSSNAAPTEEGMKSVVSEQTVEQDSVPATATAVEQQADLLTRDLFEWQELSDDGTQGHFLVQKEHLNELGNLHGGCQAMIMEQLGNAYLAKTIPDAQYELKSLQVNYMSSVGQSVVILEATKLTGDNDKSCTISVTVTKKDKDGASGKIISEGVLNWVNIKSLTQGEISS